MVQKGFVPGFPVIAFPENVPEFDQGDIPNPGTSQESLNSLVGSLGLNPVSQSGMIRPETDIDDGYDPFGQENFQVILRVPATVPDCVKFHWDLVTALFYDIL